MAVNSSSSSNVSHHPLHFMCTHSTHTALIFTAFTFTNILLFLPLFVLVLHLGLQRWRRQRSVSVSHSDLFTYHMIAIELVGFLGSFLYCCGVYLNLLGMIMVGFYASWMIFSGQVLFHCLTCVERYLAVVHPITYLGLRKEGGVRLRKISIGCVWLLCFAWVGLIALISLDSLAIPLFCLLTFSLVVISFCSLSVLRALVRPGPGEVGGNRERVDQSKRRAFLTIMVILGVLLLRFGGLLVCAGVYALGSMNLGDGCVVAASALWFGLPSSSVLPLLFLHRAGKLPCC